MYGNPYPLVRTDLINPPSFTTNPPPSSRHPPSSSHPAFAIQTISLHNRSVPIHRNLYKINEELGRGNFGNVYAGIRLSDNKQVAIRVVSLATVHTADAAVFDNVMLSEIRAAKNLRKSSSHIIDVYDFDLHTDTRLAFVVMERGPQNLETALQARGKLSPKDRKDLWRQLVDIAVTLQNKNITHLNIRPSTLLMFPQNQVKLADMGIARKALHIHNGCGGSHSYAAPEVVQGLHASPSMLTPKADVWSWGAILYRVVYSTPPGLNAGCYQPPHGKNSCRDPQAIDLLKRTLAMDPMQRLDAKAMAAHPFTTTKAPI